MINPIPFGMQDLGFCCIYVVKTEKMKKWIFILAVLAMTLSGCMKDSLEKGLNRKEWLIGSWYEHYDPTVFSFDGASVVTFSADGAALWRTASFLGEGSSSDQEYRYTYEKGVLTLVSGTETEAYEVIFLSKDEMAWQRVGTTYSRGSWASDYKHFLRSKD